MPNPTEPVKYKSLTVLVKTKPTVYQCQRSVCRVSRSFIVSALVMLLSTSGFAQRQPAPKPDTAVANQAEKFPTDVLMNRLDTIHIRLNRINNFSSRGFDTREIKKELPDIEDNLNIIDENMSLYSSVLDVKNLALFQILLQDMREQLSDWRTSLYKYNKELVNMNAEIASFARDSAVSHYIQDTTYRNLYFTQLTQLKQKWVNASTSTNENIAKVNQLVASVSNDYFQVIDLQSKVRSQMRTLSSRTMSKEYDYLWQIKKPVANDRQVYDLARKSYQGQKKILQYYFQQNWDTGFWMILIGSVFFVLVTRNIRKLKKAGFSNFDKELQFTYLKSAPILATLVVLFNLVPFFDLHPPPAYVQIMQFFLLVTLTILFARHWQRKSLYYWLVLVVLYIVFSVTSSVLLPGIGFRFWLLTLNIFSVIFGMFFIYRLTHVLAITSMVKPVAWIYLALNILAVICNLYGRLSLAKVLSTSAIFGLTQMIGLTAFIQIIKEAVHLHLETAKRTGSTMSALSYEKVDKELSRFLKMIAGFTWLVIFTINLNIYNLLYMIISRILTKNRSIGSTSFEIGNVLLFLFIIYVSNLLQKYLGYVFGYADDNLMAVQPGKKGTRLVISRLIVIVIGFLLAVAASGLPVDKITIVLGALGVGIGLGLQAIVNNLVSGVILIFERPFQIGDYVELDNKKGIVRDIGIRSSRLITPDGAEIIMPNGDLLSGRLVNWTSRNNNVRVELPVSIEAGPNLEEVKELIRAELLKSDQVLQIIPPEIILKSISNKTLSLSVLVWIKDVNRDNTTKSELLSDIYGSLIRNEVKMM